MGVHYFLELLVTYYHYWFVFSFFKVFLLTSHEGIDGVKRTSPRRNSSTKDLPFLYLLA